MMLTDLPMPWKLQLMLVPLSLVPRGLLFSFMLSSTVQDPTLGARAGCLSGDFFFIYISCSPREIGGHSDGSSCSLVSRCTKKQKGERKPGEDDNPVVVQKLTCLAKTRRLVQKDLELPARSPGDIPAILFPESS